MDKILGLADVFGLDTSNFNTVLLIPVVFVVFGAVSVFIFGFKSMGSPRFRKFVETSSNTNTTRRKKRNAGVSAETNSKIGTAALNGKILKETAFQIQPQIVAGQQKGNTKKAVNEAIVVGTKLDRAPATPNKRQINSGAMQTRITKSTKNTTKALNKKRVLTNVNDEGDCEGEWKTVITKKQKQKPPTDSLIQAVAEVAAAAIGVNGKSIDSSVQTSRKINARKIKNYEHTGIDNIVAEAPFTPPAVAIVDESNIENETFAFQPENQQPLIIIAENKASEIVSIDIFPAASQPVNGANTNLAFDELGDAIWTESKPQKKNKRRALRE